MLQPQRQQQTANEKPRPADVVCQCSYCARRDNCDPTPAPRRPAPGDYRPAGSGRPWQPGAALPEEVIRQLRDALGWPDDPIGSPSAARGDGYADGHRSGYRKGYRVGYREGLRNGGG